RRSRTGRPATGARRPAGAGRAADRADGRRVRIDLRRGPPAGSAFHRSFNDEERCLGVAGWRLIATTVARRKLYVDDLVTTASGRSQGVGGALLDELSERARSAG